MRLWCDFISCRRCMTLITMPFHFSRLAPPPMADDYLHRWFSCEGRFSGWLIIDDFREGRRQIDDYFRFHFVLASLPDDKYFYLTFRLRREHFQRLLMWLRRDGARWLLMNILDYAAADAAGEIILCRWWCRYDYASWWCTPMWRLWWFSSRLFHVRKYRCQDISSMMAISRIDEHYQAADWLMPMYDMCISAMRCSHYFIISTCIIIMKSFAMDYVSVWSEAPLCSRHYDVPLRHRCLAVMSYYDIFITQMSYFTPFITMPLLLYTLFAVYT